MSGKNANSGGVSVSSGPFLPSLPNCGSFRHDGPTCSPAKTCVAGSQSEWCPANVLECGIPKGEIAKRYPRNIRESRGVHSAVPQGAHKPRGYHCDGGALVETGDGECHITQKLPSSCSPHVCDSGELLSCPKVTERLPNRYRRVVPGAEFRPKISQCWGLLAKLWSC